MVVVLAMLALAVGLTQAQGLPSFPHTDETKVIRFLSTNAIPQPQQHLG
jgi:hypothetical protein